VCCAPCANVEEEWNGRKLWELIFNSIRLVVRFRRIIHSSRVIIDNVEYICTVHSGSDVSVKLIQLRAGLLRIKGRDVDVEMPTPIKRYQRALRSSSQSHSSSRVLIRERTYKQVVITIRPPSQIQETIENVEFSSNYFLFINAIRLWWINVEGDTFRFDWSFKYGLETEVPWYMAWKSQDIPSCLHIARLSRVICYRQHIAFD
jgi:hypothetical protein